MKFAETVLSDTLQTTADPAEREMLLCELEKLKGPKWRWEHDVTDAKELKDLLKVRGVAPCLRATCIKPGDPQPTANDIPALAGVAQPEAPELLPMINIGDTVHLTPELAKMGFTVEELEQMLDELAKVLKGDNKRTKAFAWGAVATLGVGLLAFPLAKKSLNKAEPYVENVLNPRYASRGIRFELAFANDKMGLRVHNLGAASSAR